MKEAVEMTIKAEGKTQINLTIKPNDDMLDISITFGEGKESTIPSGETGSHIAVMNMFLDALES